MAKPNALLDKLDAAVVDIEFLLISVIQSVVLGFLATESMRLISGFMLEYWLYVATAFVFLLTFWSQAIIHALSFIRWPLDLIHTFLYFLASFLEIIVIHHLDQPLLWFGFMGVFLVVAGSLYLYDFRLIKKRQADMTRSPTGEKLYTLIRREHLFEMGILLPSGLIYTLLAFVLIRSSSDLFIAQHYHLILIGIQFFFSLAVLLNSIRSFQKRATLLAEF